VFKLNIGEKLFELRKEKNLSQEEVADKLNVSRQAISKWESNDCYPETEKLIKICEIFNCSMDTIIKGRVQKKNETTKTSYEKIMNKFSKGIALGVFLILLGTTFLLGIISRSTDEKNIITGVIILLIFVLFTIPIFIIRGLEIETFKRKNPLLENFYTSEEIDKYDKVFSKALVISISIIILGVIVFMALYGFKIFNGNVIMQVSILMIFITISTPILVYHGIQKDKYDIEKHNKANNYIKENEELLGKISGVIMIMATIIYFILGFIWNLWKYNWLIYPICGMICGIFAIILQKEK